MQWYNFSLEYSKSQVDDYLRSIKVKLPYKTKNLRLDTTSVGDCTQYVLTGTVPMLFHIQKGDYWIETSKLPRLIQLPNTLWMSLSPMEIQTHVRPIELAKGRVGVGGLGLGYYVHNVLKKKEVSEVVVYENNQEIIDLFGKIYGGCTDKLEIVRKDVLTVKDQEFDFFYMDIYERAGMDEMFPDYLVMEAENSIKNYYAWSQEIFLSPLWEIEQGIITPAVVGDYFKYPIKKVYREYWKMLENSCEYFQCLRDFTYEENIIWRTDIIPPKWVITRMQELKE